MLTLAAETSSRGWGGPVALLVAVGAFVLFIGLHWLWMQHRGIPSPSGRGDTGSGVKPQVSSVSDTDDTDRDTGWWGRIVERDGRRVRATAPPPNRDDEVDLDLVDEEPESIEDAVGRMLDQGHPYMEIVRQVMDEFDVSEATAKRAIRDVRAERIAQAS
ncbi:hypothetical protein Vwe01_59560 [Micromonospora andamanensis]|nr:hypothetical protein Vwe01_59560 [Micromonospora andamanensis]